MTTPPSDNTSRERIPTQEHVINAPSGWLMLFIVIVLIAAAIAAISGTVLARFAFAAPLGAVLLIAGFILSRGLFTLQPNESRICVLFGKYKGTVKKSGFYWVNPFYTKSVDNTRHGKISLRARTMNGERIKVNDKHGNPIEIAMVVVWRVANTAQAVFDVDDYQTYVTTQSETALRHVATAYSYDHGEDSDEESGEITLRSNVEEVSASLKAELANRLEVAGVVVDDARLTHLAYAPEIAQAMLRRQQAEAIIAARKKIVEGAVSMVEMALEQLDVSKQVDMDEAHKSSLVGNLMVVLCSDSDATPIVNTGIMTD